MRTPRCAARPKLAAVARKSETGLPGNTRGEGAGRIRGAGKSAEGAGKALETQGRWKRRWGRWSSAGFSSAFPAPPALVQRPWFLGLLPLGDRRRHLRARPREIRRAQGRV